MVIAIIAILAGLSGAKGSARRVHCRNDMEAGSVGFEPACVG